MIQFNLLPDVKQHYIRAKRMKRTAIVVSILVAASSVFVFVMLFLSVYVFQKKHTDNVNKDIQASVKTLKETRNLNKILTIQNQLNVLPSLHAQKPKISKLDGYLGQITPARLTIGEIEIDFELKTMKITGTAESLELVNKFVDTIKFTKSIEISAKDNSQQVNPIKPFTSTVLSSYERRDIEVTYEITLVYDPAIFDNNKNIKLEVPKITTTRSELNEQSELYRALPKKNEQ
jgi:hypothetical protein